MYVYNIFYNVHICYDVGVFAAAYSVSDVPTEAQAASPVSEIQPADNGSNHVATATTCTTATTSASEATVTGDNPMYNGGVADSHVVSDGSSSISGSNGVTVDEMIAVQIDVSSCSSYPSPSYWEVNPSMLVGDADIDDNIISDVPADFNVQASSSALDHPTGDLPHQTDASIALPTQSDQPSSPTTAQMNADEDVDTTNSSPASAARSPSHAPLADCLALAPTVSYWANPQTGPW